MEFQKERVFTALNADELKIGSKVTVADDLLALKESVLKHRLPKILRKVEPEDHIGRFLCDDNFHYCLAYLVEESEEKKLKWTDLKVGDVIRNDEISATSMVTRIDPSINYVTHIFADNVWLTDYELEGWKKVEE